MAGAIINPLDLEEEVLLARISSPSKISRILCLAIIIRIRISLDHLDSHQLVEACSEIMLKAQDSVNSLKDLELVPKTTLSAPVLDSLSQRHQPIFLVSHNKIIRINLAVITNKILLLLEIIALSQEEVASLVVEHRLNSNPQVVVSSVEAVLSHSLLEVDCSEILVRTKITTINLVGYSEVAPHRRNNLQEVVSLEGVLKLNNQRLVEVSLEEEHRNLRVEDSLETLDLHLLLQHLGSHQLVEAYLEEEHSLSSNQLEVVSSVELQTLQSLLQQAVVYSEVEDPLLEEEV